MAKAFPLSEQQRLATAIQALAGWTQTADEQNIRVTQVNTDFLSTPDADGNRQKVATVIFELDEETGEYGMRTA
jgi:hypothetical protein